MFKSAFWICSGVLLTLIVGPLTLVASQAGQADPSDLYFVLDTGGPSLSQKTLGSYGVADVGPLGGVLAKMVHAPPSSRDQLLQAGYVMLPAGQLAEICGLKTHTKTPNRSG